MEQIKAWWTQIQQSNLWQSVFSRWLWNEWIAFVFLCFGFVQGIRKGFGAMFAGVVQMILVITLTWHFYRMISQRFVEYAGFIPVDARLMIFYAVTGFIFWAVVHFTWTQVARLFKVEIKPGFRLYGGAIFGILYAYLLWAFLAHIVILSPWGHLSAVFTDEGSISGSFVAKTAPFIHDSVMKPVRYVVGMFQSG